MARCKQPNSSEHSSYKLHSIRRLVVWSGLFWVAALAVTAFTGTDHTPSQAGTAQRHVLKRRGSSEPTNESVAVTLDNENNNDNSSVTTSPILERRGSEQQQGVQSKAMSNLSSKQDAPQQNQDSHSSNDNEANTEEPAREAASLVLKQTRFQQNQVSGDGPETKNMKDSTRPKKKKTRRKTSVKTKKKKKQSHNDNAFISDSDKTNGVPTMGLVVVYTNPDGTLGNEVPKLLHRLLHITDVPLELWTSPQADHKQLHAEFGNSPQMSFRTMVSSLSNGKKSVSMEGIAGGHIGKAYALQNSQFDVPVLLDGDVWPCSAAFLSVPRERILNGTADVIWTHEGKNKYGATLKHNDWYVSPEIDDQLEEYKEFPERNTGTMVSVRRTNPIVKMWLDKAMEIFVLQSTHQPRMLRQTYTDQGAFRESFFLFRNQLSEYNANKTEVCRFIPHNHQCTTCWCECSSCMLVHQNHEFEICAKHFMDEMV